MESRITEKVDSAMPDYELWEADRKAYYVSKKGISDPNINKDENLNSYIWEQRLFTILQRLCRKSTTKLIDLEPKHYYFSLLTGGVF
jgi:hypothetical protein